MNISIYQATEADGETIHSILLDAVERQKNENPLTSWTEETIQRSNLMPDFGIECFFIAYVDSNPAGLIAITKTNKYVYPDIVEGESLFIRWIAVKREFAKLGISTKLIDYAKNMLLASKGESIRLEIQRIRKVQDFYLSQGFNICGKFFDKRTPALLYQLIWKHSTE